eukprot:2680113-Amphidinium_carterae.2
MLTDKERTLSVLLPLIDTQAGVPKLQLCEAYQLVIKSMAAATEALAGVWRALEPGHTRVAMQHIWHALLGAVGLPNTSYLDKLPGTQGQKSGKSAAGKKAVQVLGGEDLAHAHSASQSSVDPIVDEDRYHERPHLQAQQGTNASDGQKGNCGEVARQPHTRKVGVPPEAGRHAKSKENSTSESGGPKAKKIGSPPTQGPKGGGTRRKYPFAKQEVFAARGDVGHGKPPPPIDVDDDTEDEDILSKYRKRVEQGRSSAMREQTRADLDSCEVPRKKQKGRTRDEGVRLTPVPPQPSSSRDSSCEAEAGVLEIPAVQWWEKRERSTGAADAPWRAYKGDRKREGKEAAVPIAPQARRLESQHQQGRTVPLGKGVDIMANNDAESEGCCQSRVVTLERSGNALVDGELGYWDGTNLIPAPPRAARVPVQGQAYDVPVHLRVPKLPAPVYPKHTDKPIAIGVSGAAMDELVTSSGKRVPIPPKSAGLLCGNKHRSLAPLEGHDMESLHVIRGVDHVGGDAASILVCLGGVMFSCGASFVQVSSLRRRGAMHVTGHITGTDGSHFQWHPFRQVGWGDDNVSRHTLINTHDLVSMYGRHCEQILRNAYADAELGLLRPRHILQEDTREHFDEQIERVRAVLQGIELDPAYN